MGDMRSPTLIGPESDDPIKPEPSYFSSQGGQIRIRIHGSRKRGEVIKSDLAASNGLVHIITKLMDSVPATVESRPDVRPSDPG